MFTKHTCFNHTFSNIIISKICFKQIKITATHCTKRHISNIFVFKFFTSSILFGFRFKLNFVIFCRLFYIYSSIYFIKFFFILFKIYLTSLNVSKTTFNFRKFIKFIPRKIRFSFFISFRIITKFILYLIKFATKTLKYYTTHYTPKSSIPKFRSLSIICKTSIIYIRPCVPKTCFFTTFFSSKKYISKMHTLLLSNMINSFFSTFTKLITNDKFTSIKLIFCPFSSFFSKTSCFFKFFNLSFSFTKIFSLV